MDNWKYFGYFIEDFERLVKVTKALICDISVREKDVDAKTISNWEVWLKDNCTDKFAVFQSYF